MALEGLDKVIGFALLIGGALALLAGTQEAVNDSWNLCPMTVMLFGFLLTFSGVWLLKTATRQSKISPALIGLVLIWFGAVAGGFSLWAYSACVAGVAIVIVSAWRRSPPEKDQAFQYDKSLVQGKMLEGAGRYR